MFSDIVLLITFQQAWILPTEILWSLEPLIQFIIGHSEFIRRRLQIPYFHSAEC
jgi:hypothetical protein